MQEGAYKTNEVAKLFGVNTETVRRWARSGRLKSVNKKGSSHWLFSKKEIDDMLDEGRRPDIEELQTPNTTVATRGYDLNSRSTVPSPDYFVNIVHHVAEFVEHMEDVEVIDGPHDKKRDLIGYRRTRYQQRELCYIQCKKVRDITEKALKKELDDLHKYLQDSKKQPLEHPDRMFFALSSNLPAAAKDRLKKYCKELLGVPLHFWCDKELNVKIQSDPRVQKLIEPIGEVSNTTTVVLGNQLQATSSTLASDDTSAPDGRIVRSGELIQQGKIAEAKDYLLELKAEFSLDTNRNYKKLARVYNNLGVCYTHPPFYDDSRAISYFLQGLESDPDLFKARGNLILAQARSDQPERDIRYQQNLLLPYLKNSAISDDDYYFIVHVLAGSRQKTDGGANAITFLEETLASKEVKRRKLQDDKDSLHMLAYLYFQEHQLDNARIAVKKALQQDPSHFESLYLDALIKLVDSVEKAEMQEHDLLPGFKDGDVIREVYFSLTELLEKAEQESRTDVIHEIKGNLYLCSVWLQRFGDPKLHVESSQDSVDKSGVIKLSEQIYNKRFNQAYEEYLEAKNTLSFSPDDNMRIADMFKYYGSPEYAKQIYDDSEDSLKDSPMFWLNRSIIEILVGNSDLALDYSFRAREMTKEDDPRRATVLSHLGAVLSRDPKEGDRMLQTTFELQEVTKKKILEGFNVDEDMDKIIKIFSDGRERMEEIAHFYLTTSLPSYALEKTLARSFFECWLNRTPDFPWIVTEPANSFYLQQSEALNKKKPIILDYESLLSISQAKLTGYVERLADQIFIDIELFDKIQTELLNKEHPVLREAWNYARSPRIKFIYGKVHPAKEFQKLEDALGEWLVRTIQVAKDEEYILFCDDLRTMKFAMNNGIEAVNTFGVLRYLLEDQRLDKKAYSKKIGQLAKCFYTFIGFDANDLHEIVWQDNYEITSGSFHLVNQIHAEGSGVASFISVFTGFISLLWQSGATSEDKIKWLEFLTKETTKCIQAKSDGRDELEDDLRQIIDQFVNLWIEPVRVAQRAEDLEALLDRLDDITGDILAKAKESIAEFIKLRLEALGGNSETIIDESK